ncbi:MAG: D-hydantoinase [Acidobacteria bacterium]|nr:D-hydantoinase [Acidobacteriota bacterium]
MKAMAGLTVLMAVCGVRADAAESGATAVVIKDATILTVSHGTIARGSILIRDGKISEVGQAVDVPDGALVIDAAAQFVMPGIIDPHSHLAQNGGVNEGSLAVTSMTSVEDFIDPTDIDIYRELAGGVTTTATLHGSANPIGGTGAVIKLRWGQDAKGLLFAGARPGLKFALGENPKHKRTQERYPGTRMGVEDVIRQAFTEARIYMQDWDEYNKRVAAGDKTVMPPRRNLTLEPLAQVLRGERLPFVHAYRADEMLMMMRVADDFGFKVNSFEHALEAYKIANELAAHGAVASTFSDWWAYKVEAYDAIPYNAALLTRKGVLVSINSDSAEEARHLNQEAAKCMKYGGLTEEEALRLVTLNPARQLKIDDRVGSIDPGKDADLVIYNHHPLSVYAVPQKVLIDGQVYFDIQKDLVIRKRMAEERKTLEEKDRQTRDKERQPRKPGDRDTVKDKNATEVPPQGKEGE